jgi:hypothetical protein
MSNLIPFRTVHRPQRGRLTILRCGAGQDSIAMLCLLVEQGLLVGGERIHVSDVDAVVFTDVGNEWRSTMALLPRIHAFCDRHGLRFLAQMKPSEEEQEAWLETLAPLRVAARAAGTVYRGTPPWRVPVAGESIEQRAERGYYHARVGIMADYQSKDTIVALTDASCTANHKIGPSRALIEDLSNERFGLGNRQWAAAVKRGDRLPHQVLLGIAADEAGRASVEGGPLYEANFYPLIEMGISKPMEGEILRRHGFGDVRKSGCVMCKFQPAGWYWALSVVEPDTFAKVVAYEARARAKNPNLLIFPAAKKSIAEVVRAWRARNPDATVDSVLDKSYERCDRMDGKLTKKPAAFAVEV